MMEISDLTVEEIMKVELRFVSTIRMAVFVLTFGMKWMPKLSVDS